MAIVEPHEAETIVEAFHEGEGDWCGDGETFNEDNLSIKSIYYVLSRHQDQDETWIQYRQRKAAGNVVHYNIPNAANRTISTRKYNKEKKRMRANY